ncbi:MAG: phage protein NinX family protein [Azonexus sp.]|nr:phage protein NinX family protein [Azonexus sp.]
MTLLKSVSAFVLAMRVIDMKIQISNLIDALLDWAVAKCDGKMLTPYAYGFLTSNGYPFRPSSNWGQGGLVIERERIKLKPSKDGGEWLANLGACLPTKRGDCLDCRHALLRLIEAG